LATSYFSYASGWTSQDQYPRELADVNFDGRADIVGFGQAGVWVSLNNGAGGFAAPTLDLTDYAYGTGWTSEHQYPRELADVTGDQRADIVAFGLNSVYTSASHDYLLV